MHLAWVYDSTSVFEYITLHQRLFPRAASSARARRPRARTHARLTPGSLPLHVHSDSHYNTNHPTWALLRLSSRTHGTLLTVYNNRAAHITRPWGEHLSPMCPGCKAELTAKLLTAIWRLVANSLLTPGIRPYARCHKHVLSGHTRGNGRVRAYYGSTL